jgi:hypothetical protein
LSKTTFIIHGDVVGVVAAVTVEFLAPDGERIARIAERSTFPRQLYRTIQR